MNSTGISQPSHLSFASSSFKEPGLSFRLDGNDKNENAFASVELDEKIAEGKPFKTLICHSKNQRAVEAFYFPGISSKRALIIGGMHGSELSSIELAYHLIEELGRSEKTYYSVLIIPVLFPDNAAKALEESSEINSSTGRYTSEDAPDPNRQMPAPGYAFDPEAPFDFLGREIEKENQYLLQLIQEYKPQRIANLHAIRDVTKAGIFVDPRADHNGFALGFANDSLLAVSMNQVICTNGGQLGSGNPENLCVVYHKDPPIVQAGFVQPRNIYGSRLPAKRGMGISLGTWATTSVCHDDPKRKREAIPLITVEFPGCRSSLFLEREEKFNYIHNLRIYALALSSVFLNK